MEQRLEDGGSLLSYSTAKKTGLCFNGIDSEFDGGGSVKPLSGLQVCVQAQTAPHMYNHVHTSIHTHIPPLYTLKAGHPRAGESRDR